jgi:hypothetical protein
MILTGQLLSVYLKNLKGTKNPFLTDYKNCLIVLNKS